MNIQVAATHDGDVAAVGPFAVHCSLHDANAFDASGLMDIHAGIHAAADLVYTDAAGIELIPFKKTAGGELDDLLGGIHRSFQPDLRRSRACHRDLTTWTLLHQEGCRFHQPTAKFEETSTGCPSGRGCGLAGSAGGW